jgi:tetratricopeptide (TPR) repeat protein
MTLFEQLGPAAMEADDLYLLGIALARTGNSKASIEVWEKALKADPDHPASLYEMIQVHLAADRFQAAFAAATRLARDPAWRDRADALMGQIELRRDNPEKTIELWQSILATEPSQPASNLAPVVSRKELALALLRVQRPAEARHHLQNILRSGPDPEVSWLMSRAYLQEGELSKALAASQAAGSFAEDNPTLHDPAVFTGAVSCARCHAEKYQAQHKSRHARTFHHIAELRDLELPKDKLADPSDPRVTHTLQWRGDHLEQKTSTPGHLYQAIVNYAFGSGDRGKTMVGHNRDGHFFELRVSVYHEKTSEAKWDVTSGHAAQPSLDEEFLGRPLSDDGVRRCFSCHVTSPQLSLEAPALQTADPAIGCEKCHGPGGNHLLAVEAKFPDLAISRPSLASGALIVKICAQCHSPRGKRVEPDDPGSVRFQGTTLTWSRCYTESKGKLDCVTCHDPHRDAVTEARHYEARCLSCHQAGQTTSNHMIANRFRKFDLSDPPHASTCPVNPADSCLSCHMPKVKGVVPYSSFTDHFIRVHRENSPPGTK